jgi:hypothetical protein
MKTTGYFHGENGSIVERRSFDAEPHLEEVKALHNAGMLGSSEMKHAFHAPVGFPEYYCQLKGITYRELMTDDKLMREMLNDHALKGLRPWKGRV